MYESNRSCAVFFFFLVVFWEQVRGHGWEVADREDDAHEAVPCLEVEMAGSEEVQLDLGLSDITEYSTYSKLWRTL